MRVLGIETATLAGSVALIEGDRLVAETTLSIEATHSERLLPAIDRLLEDAQVALREVEGLAVSIGPGSFTGLRIGIGTAQGLGHALGLRIAAVPTLEAHARNAVLHPGTICPMIDARKREVFAALFLSDGSRIERLSQDRVIDPDGFISEIRDLHVGDLDVRERGVHKETLFLGSGARRYRAEIERMMGHRARVLEEALSAPRALHVARLGAELLAAGEGLAAADLRPRYIRPSEAEIKYQQKQALKGRFSDPRRGVDMKGGID